MLFRSNVNYNATSSSLGDTGTVDDDGGNAVLDLEIIDTTGNDTGDAIEITSADGSFDGSVTLQGISNFTNLGADNFNFSG